MHTFEVRRIIAASPEAIWAHLTDASTLVAGGLGIRKLEGTIAPGAAIKVTSEVDPGRAFALTVTEFTPSRRMVWSGGMPLGLFTGTRTFTLTPATGGTEFHMHETFTGLLAPLMGRTLPDLQPSFELFADGLKHLAEGSTR